MEALYHQFTQSSGICTDTRNIELNSLFLCIKGVKFDGNTFASKALEQGALHVIIDDEAYFTDPAKMTLVENSVVCRIARRPSRRQSAQGRVAPADARAPKAGRRSCVGRSLIKLPPLAKSCHKALFKYKPWGGLNLRSLGTVQYQVPVSYFSSDFQPWAWLGAAGRSKIDPHQNRCKDGR